MVGLFRGRREKVTPEPEKPVVREEKKEVVEEEKKEEVVEEGKMKVYDWIDNSQIGVIEEGISKEGEVVEYVVRHPMGNIIHYPKSQISVINGKYYLYPYSVSNAVQLAEIFKERLSRCEELVRLRDHMNVSIETYEENVLKILSQREMFEKFGKTSKDLDFFAKRLGSEIEKILAEAGEARSSNVVGEISDEEFQKRRAEMGERAQIMTSNKKFLDDLLNRMTKNHARLSELLREIEEKEGQPEEGQPG